MVVASSVWRPRSNLPAEATSFVGRRREVAEARAMLARSRLVTLVGVGGVGKTRLGLRVASSMNRAFADGVWFVDLSGLSGPRMLAQAVAEAVEVRETSTRDPLAVLADHVRNRQMLVVLDNCEHLLQECAELAATVLKAGPQLRLLATSRQALNISAETIMVVPPLSVTGSTEDAQGGLDHSEGLTLFVERATAATPRFALTPQDRATVSAICRRLDGLPLAIELAAARVRVLSPEQILSRLQDRFSLLSATSRDADVRHQSLQALIDWSYALCSPPERLVWQRSSVFAGAFGLDAAEAICVDDDIAAGDVLDIVAGLVDKSILVQELHGDVARYRQIETIREYGRQRLADGIREVRCRHRAHYQHVAAQTARECFGPREVAWFSNLRWEHADLREALEHCATDREAAADGLRMAADLLYHWLSSSFLNEGRSWLDHMLGLNPAPTPARLDALWANAWLALIQNDLTSAQSMLVEARELGERLGAAAALCYVAVFTGMAAMFDGDTGPALECYEEALYRSRSTGNRHALAFALIRMSMAYSYLGQNERAIALGEECRAVCDEVGDIWHKAYATTALGIQVWHHSDTQRAAELENESLEMNQALDDQIGIALNLEVLALIAATEHQYERAARLLGALKSLHRWLGISLEQYTHLSDDRAECEHQITSVLGERAFQTLLKDGAKLSSSEAVDLALHGEPRPVPVPRRGDTSQLTTREHEIAELVAQGKSNKAIASALTIATRTAESHVEHILIKLGFTSRAQIATWVVEQAKSR